mgnify:CR=1 FL=1
MSYRDFYCMQDEAFGSLPVLNLFYGARTHQDGWRYLLRGIAAREPFLLVPEPLTGKDGGRLWDKKIGYRVRPVVIGDTLHAEPWAYDLRTGKQQTRVEKKRVAPGDHQ